MGRTPARHRVASSPAFSPSPCRPPAPSPRRHLIRTPARESLRQAVARNNAAIAAEASGKKGVKKGRTRQVVLREGLRLREQSTHFHPLRGAEYHALPRVAPEDAELMDYDGTACEGAPGERRGLLSVRPC